MEQLPNSVVIRGRRYKLRAVRASQMLCKADNPMGECDPPDMRGKQIRVRKTLRGERLLEVLLHEMLHAAYWDMDETAIDITARDIARALWRAGYRREA